MKTKHFVLAAAVLSAVSLSTFSQGNYTNKNNTVATPAYGNNWFISAGAGPGVLLGEQDSEKSLGDRLQLGGELSVGKWFNPQFGMRLQLSGAKMKGFNFLDNRGGVYTRSDRGQDAYPTGYYTDELKKTSVDGQEGFWQKFNSYAFTIDLMGNLTHLFRGYYREQSPVEVIPFAGIGLAFTEKSATNPSFYGPVGKIGVRVNFNVSQKLAVYLEPQMNVTTEEFDGYAGNRNFDAYSHLFVGLQYNLNKGFHAQDYLSASEVNHLNQKINANRQLIDNHQTILERQQALLGKLEDCCEEKTQIVERTNETIIEKAYLPEYIRFGLNRANIETSEQTKIEDAARYLKAHPGSKLLLIGYADKKTGNASINYKLSCQRVETVAGALNKHGIPTSRLIVKCVGDKEQPYDQNDWNRVVVMIER